MDESNSSHTTHLSNTLSVFVSGMGKKGGLVVFAELELKKKNPNHV